MDLINQFVLDAAGSPWILLVVLLFTIIDGFFPPLPSESIVVGLAAISIGTGQPSLLLLALAAAAGAMIGDNITYEVGRRIGRGGLTRYRWMRTPWFTKAIAHASEALQRRVSSAVLAGRFIPGGRVAVNLMAGVSQVPARVFRPLTVLSGLCWAAYSIAIGTIAGAWVREHPVLGALVAVGLGIVLGVVIDTVMSLIRRRRAAAQTLADPDVDAAESDRTLDSIRA